MAALPATAALESEPVMASPAAEALAAPAAASPPRGFLARLRWWFGAPADDAQAPVPVAPASLPVAEAPLPVAEAAQRDARAATPAAQVDDDPAPVVLPFPGGQPTPAPAPEVLPAAASSASSAPVDNGTIVGILTGVLDELGSAHHRPFSRG